MHTDQMACLQCEEFSRESIENWMADKNVPEFSAWFGDNEGEEILYAYTNIVNELAGIEETIWISAGIVKDNEFDDFKNKLNTYWEGRQELLDVADFHAWQECHCYCTPQEACTVQSHKEKENNIIIESDNTTIDLYKLVTECMTEHVEDTEATFAFPSRLIRELTGITYGDGYHYLNKDGETISQYNSAGENWKKQQKSLLMNRPILRKALDQNQYKLFWLFRVYRSPSHKAYEAFEREIMHDTDRCFVVWYDNDEYKYVELQTIEPPRREMTKWEVLINFADENLSL